MKMQPSFLLLISLAITGCSGGSSSSPNASSNGDNLNSGNPAPPALPLEKVPGYELIGDMIVEPFEARDGIRVDIIEFELFIDIPRIKLHLHNDSSSPITAAGCDLTAFIGNQSVESNKGDFAALETILPGESAVDTNFWFDTKTGFTTFDRVSFSCSWIEGASRKLVREVTTGTVTFDFVEYSSRGRPALTGLLTNNSAETIYSAICSVKAKSGRLILDVAYLFFNELGDVNPGEAVEDDGTWLQLSNFDQFDSEPFNRANMECGYLIR